MICHGNPNVMAGDLSGLSQGQLAAILQWTHGSYGFPPYTWFASAMDWAQSFAANEGKALIAAFETLHALNETLKNGKDLTVEQRLEIARKQIVVATKIAVMISPAIPHVGAFARGVRVYRVEGLVNTRILIGPSGEVAIVGDTMLFLNFGSRQRAEEFLAKRISQGMTGAQIKSFEVPQSVVDDLRSAAVPESMASMCPGSPIIVDTTKAPNQFGIRPPFHDLEKSIKPGSGKVVK
jgi:hypothetical protein